METLVPTTEIATGSLERAPRLVGALHAYRTLAVRVALTDALCAALAVAGAELFHGASRFHDSGSLWTVPLAIVVGAMVFGAYRLYDFPRIAPWQEFRRLLAAVSVSIVGVVLATGWRASISRTWVGLAWGFWMALALIGRRIWHLWMGRAKRDGTLNLRTLIVGGNGEAGALADWMAGPASGFTAIGMVDAVGAESLERVIRASGAEALFVAGTSVSRRDMTAVLRAARVVDVPVWVSANLPEMLDTRLAPQAFGDVIALSLRPVRLSGVQSFLKRGFDLLVAGLALVVLLPIGLFIALAIKVGSRGPALFRQPRTTKGGREFTMLKFRTMHRDADRILLERGIDPSVPFFKIERDPRLTRVGRILRRASLDELPQLLNVVRGDMSLVGPRPLPADQVRANGELLEARHEVRAGLTGWWQINGRSDLDAEAAVRLDAFYIENWSLSLDLYIVLKTFGAILRGKGAR